MSRGTYLEIDLDALRHNHQRVRHFASGAAIIAMIKANAYGHGLIEVAKALSDANALGVAFLDEAVQLRAAGIKNAIVVMQGVLTAEECEIASDLDLDIVVHHIDQLNLLEKIRLKAPLFVWLKIDTGLHRLGFLPPDVHGVIERLTRCQQVKSFRFLSHFSEPDDLTKNTTEEQFNLFLETTKNFSVERSISNSAGIISWPKTHLEWVRPGIMIYGVSPFKDKIGQAFGLKPVMTLRSELIAVKELRKGDCVGYGGTWICPEAIKIGVVAIGYGDGYPRHAKNGTPVWVNGQNCDLVGRVSMDMIMVDLRHQPFAKIGDPVVLWGNELPVEQVAAAAGTISYELLCQVTPRVKRIHKEFL